MVNYFSDKELACQHCGENRFDLEFLEALNSIRLACGFPLPVSSGYRCPEHPIEASKSVVGAHCSGKAVDISISGDRAYRLVEIALAHGVPRIGVNQKGGARFIHLDWDGSLPTPAIWSY